MRITYTNIGECCMCDKKAEVIYFYESFLMRKFRLFCHKHAKQHQIIKNTH